MTIALLFGFFIGIGLIIYRGLYAGHWSEAFSTLGSTIIAAIIVYIFLRILASLGSLFLRLLLIILFIGAIYSARGPLSRLFFGATKTLSTSVTNIYKELSS